MRQCEAEQLQVSKTARCSAPAQCIHAMQQMLCASRNILNTRSSKYVPDNRTSSRPN